MKTGSRWPQLLVLVILVLLAMQGLINAMRPIIGWLVGLAVLAVIVLLIIKKLLRW